MNEKVRKTWRKKGRERRGKEGAKDKGEVPYEL